MKRYANTFKYLVEADLEAAANPAPEAKPELTDREAMASKLDKGSSPEDFDVHAPDTNTTRSQEIEAQKQMIKDWIEKIDLFIEFLNAPNEESVQYKLHNAGCHTLFEDIARSEKKKIARLAAELSSLSEALKGYFISAEEQQ